MEIFINAHYVAPDFDDYLTDDGTELFRPKHINYCLNEPFALKSGEDISDDIEQLSNAAKRIDYMNKEDISKPDNVNHPKHYATSNGMEAIDVIESFTEELDPKEAINTAQVLKYMLRWGKKNGLEDLKKAQWYLNRLIGIVEDERND